MTDDSIALRGLLEKSADADLLREMIGFAAERLMAPEARGRSERAFGTLQDRLPKEFALAGVTTLEAANRFLAEVYLPEHNARFAVAPEHPETAFVADLAGAHRGILCVQEERVVGNDSCVRCRGLSLQIPPSNGRPSGTRLEGQSELRRGFKIV